jgi:hypothetical protein
VFWQNLSCPGYGRWQEVHHVGMYVGDGKVMEASSSKGRVLIRDLWESASWPIFCFGRIREKQNGQLFCCPVHIESGIYCVVVK